MADTGVVQRRIICVVGITVASVVASAQAPNGGAPGPVLGIVEIPDVFFLDDEKGEYVPRAALTIWLKEHAWKANPATLTERH